MRPTWRIPGAIALWLALTWFGATSGVPWLFLLSAWVLVLMLCALAYAWWNWTGLQLRLDIARSRPSAGSPLEWLPDGILRAAPSSWPLFEGDHVEVEVALTTVRRAQGPAWVVGQVGGVRVTAGTGLVPRSGWRRPLSIAEVARGRLGASGWILATSDPMGFFIGRRSYPDSEVAIVYPRFASLSRRRPVRELETVASAPRAGSGNEIFGTREYRPGDSLRRIHWRSSARRGELVVREYEPPGLHALRLTLDPTPPTRSHADQIARIAASEAWDCLREGGRVRIGDTESRDLWDVLDLLARYPEIESGQSSRAEVVITANPELISADATRNWLVGDAPIDTDIGVERVGTTWPL